MAKDKLVKDQDKVIVRLPDGMRDRIKAAAERHDISMNEEIVRVLRRAFPEPVSIEKAAEDIESFIRVLRPAAKYQSLSNLIDNLHELASDIAEGRVVVEDEDVKRDVYYGLEELYEDQFDSGGEEYEEAGEGEPGRSTADRIKPIDKPPVRLAPLVKK